jgi:hypothetical protein
MPGYGPCHATQRRTQAGQDPRGHNAELGEQLEAHIRLEVREAFPLMEDNLPEHTLQEVVSWLEVFGPGPPHEP